MQYSFVNVLKWRTMAYSYNRALHVNMHVATPYRMSSMNACDGSVKLRMQQQTTPFFANVMREQYLVLSQRRT